MRRVTLFSADKKIVNTHSDYITIRIRDPIRLVNSTDFVDRHDVSHVEHLPIERWVFNGNEFLIALDPWLRDIVDKMIYIEVEKTKRPIQELIKVRDEYISYLKSKNESLLNRGVWDTIKHHLLKWVRK